MKENPDLKTDEVDQESEYILNRGLPKNMYCTLSDYEGSENTTIFIKLLDKAPYLLEYVLVWNPHFTMAEKDTSQESGFPLLIQTNQADEITLKGLESKRAFEKLRTKYNPFSI